MKKSKSSKDKLFGWNSVTDEFGDKYLTRIFIWRLRLHIFHRGDDDPDCHDHPWGFYTFPFNSYWEEVLEEIEGEYKIISNVVTRFRWHYRPATYCHRVVGPLNTKRKKIITLVWREAFQRKWGFKVVCSPNKIDWIYWREYLWGGGKEKACQDDG